MRRCEEEGRGEGKAGLGRLVGIWGQPLLRKTGQEGKGGEGRGREGKGEEARVG